MPVYYLDTSIWLDFIENRDESHLQKGEIAHKLLNKIVAENSRILVSDIVVLELRTVNYSQYEISSIFSPLKRILIFVKSTEKEVGRAKDLALKRNVPKGDALHALIARNNRAIMVTLDKHFQALSDIIEPKRPQDLIFPENL